MQIGTTVICAPKHTGPVNEAQEAQMALFNEQNIQMPIPGKYYTVEEFHLDNGKLCYFLAELQQVINTETGPKRLCWNAAMFMETNRPVIPQINVAEVFYEQLQLTDKEKAQIHQYKP